MVELLIAINGIELVKYPNKFSVKVMDLDDGETTTRTADGRLTRDRITVKRQIEMAWPPLQWEVLSELMQAMQDEFVQITYPDPMTGQQETKSFYAGDRTAPVALERNGVMWWQGLEVTLTEE